MTRRFPLMASALVLLVLAALAFALLPRLLSPSTPPSADRGPLAPDATAPAATGSVPAPGEPRYSLFPEGGPANPTPPVTARPPSAFGNRPGGLFSAPAEGR